MASTLPSPPASRESSPLQRNNDDADASDSIQRLDALLEQYLELLDEYSKLRETLSSTFANGFISLAHAQRTSNLGPGRRYGQDGYDGRMKALKRVALGPDRNAEGSDSSTAKAEAFTGEKNVSEVDSGVRVYDFRQRFRSNSSFGEEKASSQERSSSEPNVAESEETSSHSFDTSNEKDSTHTKSKIDPAYRDPVTWYGILVPPHLRTAQRAFSSSVEDVIPKILSTSRSLQELEASIRTVRKNLGTEIPTTQDKTSSMTNRSVTQSSGSQ